TGYVLEGSVTEEFTTSNEVYCGPKTSYLRALAPWGLHYFRVKAVGGAFMPDSDWSDVVSGWYLARLTSPPPPQFFPDKPLGSSHWRASLVSRKPTSFSMLLQNGDEKHFLEVQMDHTKHGVWQRFKIDGAEQEPSKLWDYILWRKTFQFAAYPDVFELVCGFY